jgi:hypothetical protein
MTYRATLLSLMVFGAACSSSNVPTSPLVFVPPVTNPVSTFRQVAVGEVVTGTMDVHGINNAFELMASSDGTLELQLTWVSSTDSRVGLLLDGARVSQTDHAIVATLSVAAGRKYLVQVGDASPWDYDTLALSWVLTSAIK